MTPESVLKAMAEALAKKYTSEGRPGHERSMEERMDRGMMVVYPDTDGHNSIRATTCQEAAVEAMTVVGPILELAFRMKDALKTLAKSHKEFIDEWAPHDADASTLETQFMAETLIGLVEVQEPADWMYLRQFSATPNEIHDILKSGLHPNVLKAFTDAVKNGDFD